MNVQKFTIYNPYSNQAVTSFYVDIITEALQSLGYETEKKNALTYDKDNFGIVIVTAKDYKLAKKCGYRHILLWLQGLPPEESFMRNHSYLRKFILSIRDRNALKHSNLVFLVSEKMREFLENKYRISFKNKYMIMPCFNTELDKASFSVPEKYEKNVFTYTGSLASWQCFEQTARLYSQIEQALPDCRFDVYTSEKAEAEALLKKYGVKNYRIDFVTPSELTERLKCCKFGFVLREDDPVNNVATPTKFSTYLSNGVIPIFSSCIDGFYRATQDMKYVVALDSFTPDKVFQFCKSPVNVDELTAEYVKLFDTYYNRQLYVENISNFIKNYIQEVQPC